MILMTDLSKKSIPKIIHYCWFGPNDMDRIHKKCLKSWKRNLPEFEFMKWDESNIDIAHHPFLKAAFKLGKWAFVSDYIRLQKLYEYGGIYLDTDMLIFRPLDQFLKLDSFFCAENSIFINCAIMGTRKENSFIKKCLLKYDEVILGEKTKLASITIPQIVTSTFRSTFDYTGNFTKVVRVPGITIFPAIYFYSLPYKQRYLKNKKKYISGDSYGLHLWDESWKDHSEFQYFRKGMYLKGYKKILRSKEKAFSYMYLKKIFTSILKSITSG